MKKFLTNKILTSVVISCLLVALGILVIINPNTTSQVIAYILGGIFTAGAVLALVAYFVNFKDHNAILLVYAAPLIVLGALLLALPGVLKISISLVAAVMLLLNGLLSFNDAFTEEKKNLKIFDFCVCLLGLGLGIAVLVLALGSYDANLVLYFLGAALIVEGALDIVTAIAVGRALRIVTKTIEEVKEEAKEEIKEENE